MIPAFERVKTLRALDHAATVMGTIQYLDSLYICFLQNLINKKPITHLLLGTVISSSISIVGSHYTVATIMFPNMITYVLYHTNSVKCFIYSVSSLIYIYI
jgi:hypothetical protein